jgi:hypothetical protein
MQMIDGKEKEVMGLEDKEASTRHMCRRCIEQLHAALKLSDHENGR